MNRSVGVDVAVGTTVAFVGDAVCWPLLEEALVLKEMKRLGKMVRQPTRWESEGEQLWFLSGVWLSWG